MREKNTTFCYITLGKCWEVLLIAIGVILKTGLKTEITPQGNIYQKLLDN